MPTLSTWILKATSTQLWSESEVGSKFSKWYEEKGEGIAGGIIMGGYIIIFIICVLANIIFYLERV